VAIAANPDNAPQAYYYRALLYNQMERYEDAVEDLTKALEQEPHFPQAYAARAAVYLALNRPASAVEDLKRAIELGLNDDPTVYLNLGQAYFQMDIYDAAEESFRKALELAPDMAAVHFNLGTLYLKKGDDEAALEHLSYGRESKSTPRSEDGGRPSPDESLSHFQESGVGVGTGGMKSRVSNIVRYAPCT